MVIDGRGPGPGCGDVRRRSAGWTPVAAVLCLVSGCSSASPASTGGAAPAASATTSVPGGAAPPAATAVVPTPMASATPAVAPPTAAVATLAGCPPPVALGSLTALRRITSVDVDDVTVTADGHLWVTAVTSGKILELDATGALLRTIDDPRSPEGIVELPGGALAVAEQRANRVARLDRATGTFTELVGVPNTTANEGVDGLGLDAAGSRLLIPDSANGRLDVLPLSADGHAAGPLRVVATKLGRPVAAWMDTAGIIEVAVENAPGLIRVDAAGGVTAVSPNAGFGQLDEVLGRHGLLYVTDLVSRRLEAVDPVSGTVAVLVLGSPTPQGLAILADGRLLLIDTQTRELVVVPGCG